MSEENNKVLIVDDDETALSVLSKAMQTGGLDSHSVTSGEDALAAISSGNYELILMDINLPGMDGFETIKKIRESTVSIPIMIVSARNDDFDTLYGLDIGADDYVTKPFNPVTLGAKAKALIRRSRYNSQEANPMIKAGPFSFNASTLRLYKNNAEIMLSSKENAMMKLFMDNINKIFTKEMIYEMIWSNDVVDEHTVMVYVNRLRQKIEDDPSSPKFIQTVRGLGYTFVV